MMNWSTEVADDANEDVSAHQESEEEGGLLGNVCADDLHDLPPVYDVEEVRAELLRAHQQMVRMVRRWIRPQPRRRRRGLLVLPRLARRRERRARSRRSSRASLTARPARPPEPEPPSCSLAPTIGIAGVTHIPVSVNLFVSVVGARRTSHV